MGSFWCKQTIRISDNQGSATITTDKPYALIGSHPKCDIQIKDANLLSVHYYLHATDEGLFCLSLTEDRTHHGWLQPSQPIRCGDLELFASLAASDAQIKPGEQPDLDAPHSLPSMFPIVTLNREGEELAVRQLTAPLTIVGRTRPSVIRVRSDTVSRVHCVLYFTAGVLWTIDLHSTNRVFFEGRPHAVVALKLGEAVEVEPVYLTFREITSGIGSNIQPSTEPARMSAPPKNQETSFEDHPNPARIREEGDRPSPAHSAKDKTRSIPSQVIAGAGVREETAADAVFANLGAGEENAAAAVIAHLKSRIQDLEKRLRHTTAQLSAKQALIHDTADVLQASRKATENFGERVAQLEQNVASKTSDLESAQQQLRQRDVEIQQLQDQLHDGGSRAVDEEKLQAQIQELETQLKTRTDEVTAARQDQEQQANELRTQTTALQNAQKELQTLAAQIETTNSGHALIIGESQQATELLQTQLAETKAQLAAETTAREEDQQRAREQDAKLDELAAQLATQTAQQQTLREQLASAQDAHAEAELGNEDLQATVERLKKQVSQHDADTSSADEQSEQIKQRDAELQTQEKELADLRASQKELQAKLQAAQNANQLQEQEISDSKAAANQLQQRIVVLEEDKVTQETSLEDLETQLQQRDVQLSELQTQLTNSHQQNEEAKAHLQLAEDELHAKIKALAEQQEKAEELTTKLESMQCGQTDAEKHAQHLTQEIDNRDTQVSQLKKQLADAEQLNQTSQENLQVAEQEIESLYLAQADSLATTEELQKQVAILKTDNRDQATVVEKRDQQLQQQADTIVELREQLSTDQQQRETLHDQLTATSQLHADLKQKHEEQQQRIEHLEKKISTLEDECLTEASNVEASSLRLRKAEATRDTLEQQFNEELKQRQAFAAELQLATNEIAQLSKAREETQSTLAALREQLAQTEADASDRATQDNLRHRQQVEQKDARILDLEEQLARSNRALESKRSVQPRETSGGPQHRGRQQADVPMQLSDIQQMVATANQEEIPSQHASTAPGGSQQAARPTPQPLPSSQTRTRPIEDETREVRTFAQKRKQGILPLLYKLSMAFLWIVALGGGGTMVYFLVRAILAAAAGE